jgi:topoisomerase IV subunit A
MAKKTKTKPKFAAKPKNTLRIQQTYREYFLQYASYVITDRAIPDIMDGLKPVQRRILHSLWENEDGRYNKVASIVGHCMKYHPHGDASIYSALIWMGQRELLIDRQGNWGDSVTGDQAAAARYIEARLTKFAKEVVFAPNLTQYMRSYDGRNKEPLHLPTRFPLLLAMGTEGIAVGLSTKILPHNFLEILQAQKNYLIGEPFQLFPDFPTGGFADVSHYQDGAQGGRIKARAKIEMDDGKKVIIREIPFGTTTDALIESILSASDKGKIKVAKVDDNCAAQVEIVVTFARGVDMDKAIDSLYAFTDCEVSISPNAVVIRNSHPISTNVSELLASSAKQTKALLKLQLELRREVLELKWHHKSLVQIFIENRIYLRIEKCKTWPAVLTEIDEGLKPFKEKLRGPITSDDLVMLTEVKMRRISAWDAKRAKEELAAIDKELKQIARNLKSMTKFTINYIDDLVEKYGQGKERRTVLDTFDAVKATTVVERTEKLLVNKEGGFVGTDLKNAVEVGPCSSIDEVIAFLENGEMKVTVVEGRKFVGEKIVHAQVFGEAERETVFNMIYEDRMTGQAWAKRFTVGGVTRDKAYNLAPLAKKGAKVLFLSTQDPCYVHLKLRKKPRIKTSVFLNFDDFLVKNRGAGGVTVTRHRASSANAISERVFTNNTSAEMEEANGREDLQDQKGKGGGDDNGGKGQQSLF